MRFALIAIIGFTSGCFARPSQADVEEIRVRQSHRHDGECHSWLYSHATGFKYCASPEFKVVEEIWTPPRKRVTDGPVTQDALASLGEELYGEICVACHQENGQGVEGQYPPLAGAGEYYGDAQNMSRIVVHGLAEEITVLGKTYNGAMPAQGHLSDYEIAAVTTYVRFAWGNNDGIVTPDDVKAVR